MTNERVIRARGRWRGVALPAVLAALLAARAGSAGPAAPHPQVADASDASRGDAKAVAGELASIRPSVVALGVRPEGHERIRGPGGDVGVLPQLERKLLPTSTFMRIAATVRANDPRTARWIREVARLDFGAFVTSAAWSAITASARTAGAAPSTNPDRPSGTLEADAVHRWDYRPGCTAFVVYIPVQTLAPGPRMDEHARFDLGTLCGSAARETLLFRVSYWWN